MKNFFTKTNMLFLSLSLVSAISQAQELDLETPVKSITDQIKAIFPYIAGAVFLVVVLVNLGHFVKEGGDWKKGLTNIVVYVIVVGLVAGLFQYITSVQL
ncbi:hypothetical protein EV196_11323 [Mariniflexile fucanivorans]|uniref:TrbC/VIRB2 family protein n=1 Tax=Mariniflexile fucanivorans TaxID=264023 RepID=A0A4R1RAP6_9FLAO|nr:hypothetical protein [Mariniflexile fucanivorans]TCL62482.1 hypothetical protein EV196_11323 [Mariniflexile fucanivorans]